jgi:hypothetical protein
MKPQPQYIIRGDVPVTLMQRPFLVPAKTWRKMTIGAQCRATNTGRSNRRTSDKSLLIAFGALAALFFTLALLIYVKQH